MNPNLCRVVLRARDPFEVFDLCIGLVRQRRRALFWTSLATVVPVWALCSGIAWFTEGHWAALAVALAFAPVVRVPFTVLGGRALFSDVVTARDVVRDVVATAPGTFVALIVQYGAVAVAGAASCGLGSVFAQSFLLYLPETAILERVGVQRGLRRSMRLAGGNLGIALVGAGAEIVLTAWFAILGEMTGQVLTDYILQLGAPFGSFEDGAITPFLLAGVLGAQPLYALYRLLLYVDIRTRLEGWDLQVVLRAMGLGAE